MSVISQIAPVTSIVRPLIGFGLIATVLMVFKPLLTGVLRAALMLMRPRLAKTPAKPDRLKDFILLNNMARDLEGTQPGLAAELRQFAGRD